MALTRAEYSRVMRTRGGMDATQELRDEARALRDRAADLEFQAQTIDGLVRQIAEKISNGTRRASSQKSEVA